MSLVFSSEWRMEYITISAARVSCWDTYTYITVCIIWQVFLLKKKQEKKNK